MCISQILKLLQHATELLLRVLLCLTSIAISPRLPLSCHGMCSLSLTAICKYCSLPTPATAQLGHTCNEHVLFAIRMQLSAISCSSRTISCMPVRASPLTADLEPPWTVFVHDCIARRSSSQERPTLPNISLLSSTSCANRCFGGGSLGASKPTIFSRSRYIQGNPPVSLLVLHATWQPRVHPTPYYAFQAHSFGPAYSSDYSGDGPHNSHPVYSPPPRNNYPYRIIRIIYKQPGSMSLMRGEYRHPKYVSGWLKLFLHIAFYTVVRRKTTRERKRICRTWKNLLETASAASLKTALTPAHCGTPPSLPSIIWTLWNIYHSHLCVSPWQTSHPAFARLQPCCWMRYSASSKT